MKTYIIINQYNEIIFENDNKEQVIDCAIQYLCAKYKLDEQTYENDFYKLDIVGTQYIIQNKINKFFTTDELIDIEMLRFINTSTSLENIDDIPLTNRSIFIVKHDNIELFRNYSYIKSHAYIMQIMNNIYKLNEENKFNLDGMRLKIEGEEDDLEKDAIVFKVEAVNEDDEKQIINIFELEKQDDLSIEIRDNIINKMQTDIELTNTFILFKKRLNESVFPTAQEARQMMRFIKEYDFTVEKQQILREIYKGNDQFILIYRKEDMQDKIQHILVLMEILIRLGYEVNISIVKNEIRMNINWQ